MQWCPPISLAAVDQGGPQIIIDQSLALDPHGALVTLRMAQECDTWVAASLWRTLDDSLIRMMPILTAVGDDPVPLEDPALDRAVKIWERARVMAGGRRLYWLAECREDAHLPDWVTPESFARFDVLHEALQVDDAALDAIVLAAAFQERAATILCACPEGVPRIVQEAARLGMTVTKLDAAPQLQIQQQWFAPLFMRAGLFEWARTSDTPLAFVRVVAPDLLFLDSGQSDLSQQHCFTPEGWVQSASLIWGHV